MSSSDERALLFLSPDDVPPRWRSRAVEVLMVPLLPEEASDVLNRGADQPHLGRDDEELAKLLATGLSATAIASQLGITRRSVQRRVARLRDQVGVRTTGELVSFLARRGF